MAFPLRSALRRARRRPVDLLVNVLGLALGLACFGLIALHLAAEYGADRGFAGAERTYRLVTDATDAGGEVTRLSSVPRPVLGVLAGRDPDVEAATRVVGAELSVRRPGGIQAVDAVYAEPSFFDVLGAFELAAGDPATALEAPLAVVLTADAAARLTDARPAEAVGETLRGEDGLTYTVTGVLAEGTRSHLTADALVSFATLEASGWDATVWPTFDLTAYVRLRDGADAGAFGERIRDVIHEQSPELAQMLGGEIVIGAQPAAAVYLSEEERMTLPYQQSGQPGLLRVLGLVALFVLAVAGINFVNLSTARSAERAQEVGVRKALGATRAGLAGRFLGEAVAVAIGAGVVALGLMAASLGAYGRVAGIDLALGTLVQPSVLAVGLALVVAVGLVAGAYPAVVLSGFRPATVLRGKFASGGRGARLRRGLVTAQFATSTALIVGVLVIVAQLWHLRAQDPGYDRDRVLLVSTEGLGGSMLSSVKEAFGGVPGVEAVALTVAPPGHVGWEAQAVRPRGADGASAETMEAIIGDVDYVRTLGLEVVAGRALSPERPSDAEVGVMLNEAGARALGWTPAEAVGQQVETQGREPGTVVGVLADYPHHGAARGAAPQIVYALPIRVAWAAVRTAPGAGPAVLGRLAEVWAARVPDRPFDATFQDDVYDAQYRGEERLAQALGVFGSLAVVVACLGLFGLAAHTTQVRTKEIGVRKALGATAPQIFRHLSLDFLRPVAVGFVVAVPLAWWALGEWLASFPTRVALTPTPFLVAGVLALTLSLGTVSLYTARAAATDPARALRSE